MNAKKTILLAYLITVFISPIHAEGLAEDKNLNIENAWIAEAPPVSRVMVAYMTIHNSSNKTIKIIKAESAVYSSIEFHETEHKDGMASMVRWDKLIVPANNNVQLKRGGKHLMLFNPGRRLLAGDIVQITLSTDQATTKTISVPVKKAQY